MNIRHNIKMNTKVQTPLNNDFPLLTYVIQPSPWATEYRTRSNVNRILKGIQIAGLLITLYKVCKTI